MDTRQPAGGKDSRNLHGYCTKKGKGMATIKCPHCERKIEIDAGMLRGVETLQQNRSRSVNQFASSHRFDIAAGVAPQVPPGLHVTRETPLFLPTFEANIIVPRAKAITYGFFAGGAVTLIVTGPLILGGSNIWYAVAAGLTFGGVTFFITAAWAWHKSSGFYDGLLTRFEEVIGMDINQDGQVGDRDSVDVSITSDRDAPKLETWPASKLVLVEFAKAVASKNPYDTFSESTARQAGMSRKQWLFIRDRFILNHWAYWRNPDHPRLGIELSVSGQKILRAIARGEMPNGTQADDNDLDAEGGLRLSPHQVDRSTGRGNWE